MTTDLAKQWFDQHRINLPALPEFQTQVAELGMLKTSTLSQMADIISLDPGMSMTLFQDVNGRLEKSGRHRMDSIHNSISVLSETAIREFVEQHKNINTIKNTNCRQQYRQLVNCSQHLQAQLIYAAKKQGLATNHDLQIAALLYNCGEMLTCVGDFNTYQKYLKQFRTSFSAEEVAIDTFGFTFNDLGMALCDAFFLPELVSESFASGKNRTRKACLIQHAASIANLAELGWGSEFINQAIEQCKIFVAPESQDFDKQVYQVAIQAARNNEITESRPAAINLLQTPCFDNTTPKTAEENSDSPPAHSARPDKALSVVEKAKALLNARQEKKNREIAANKPSIDVSGYGPEIKTLLMSEQANQAKLITHLFKYLQEHVHLSETALLLLSPDKKQLSVKLSNGYEAESKFSNLALETARSGLFLTVLKNKTPCWVSPANYEKYELYLPAAFRLANESRNFVIAPMYAGKKPLGIVFCSKQNSDQVLDKKAFAAFKAITTLANKGLSFLIKKKTQKAA